ncbi:MAG: putative serine protease PepD [Actinomycetota bacterium]|jgi:S1-C subfamily serine protease|nr:putative serine protease PepD [Actinomycetota bacterium]
MDRVWRHPSELPALSEPATGPGTRNGSTAPTGLRSILAPLGAGAIGALLTVAVLAAAGVFDQGGVTGVPNRATGTTRASDAIATITARIAPAIVAVRVVGKSGSRSGSGVCIRHAGQVLTSDRLVADARRIEVVTSDGTLRTARVIGNDPASDLALLTIDGQLEAADLATPRSLQIGDPVFAVGADSWVSTGIVSSLDGVVANDGPTMSGLIETNAVTEPALAGGALLDSRGRVVGIIMTTVSGHPATIAVPILLASQIADRLRADGRVDHGWLGVAGKVSSGQVFVTRLAPGGPSQRAGIRVGDIVVKVDSQPISTMDDLMAAARGHWPGDRIHIEVTRDRTDLTISVRLARMPRTSAPPPSATTTVTSATTVTSTTAQP